MDTANIISSIGALVAAFAALASISSSRLAKKNTEVSILKSEEANRHAAEANRHSINANKYSEVANQYSEQANKHAENATVISAKSWTEQYFRDVREWGDKVCDVLAAARHLNDIRNFDKKEECWVRLKSDLSSLIDRGRWYFPNQWEDEHGWDKEPAYRGLRQPIIDRMVEAYEKMSCLEFCQEYDYEEYLLSVQRDFVSEMQVILDPRMRGEEVRKVLGKFKISEKMRSVPKG